MLLRVGAGCHGAWLLCCWVMNHVLGRNLTRTERYDVNSTGHWDSSFFLSWPSSKPLAQTCWTLQHADSTCRWEMADKVRSSFQHNKTAGKPDKSLGSKLNSAWFGRCLHSSTYTYRGQCLCQDRHCHCHSWFTLKQLTKWRSWFLRTHGQIPGCSRSMQARSLASFAALSCMRLG